MSWAMLQSNYKKSVLKFYKRSWTWFDEFVREEMIDEFCIKIDETVLRNESIYKMSLFSDVWAPLQELL